MEATSFFKRIFPEPSHLNGLRAVHLLILERIQRSVVHSHYIHLHHSRLVIGPILCDLALLEKKVLKTLIVFHVLVHVPQENRRQRSQ